MDGNKTSGDANKQGPRMNEGEIQYNEGNEYNSVFECCGCSISKGANPID